MKLGNLFKIVALVVIACSSFLKASDLSDEQVRKIAYNIHKITSTISRIEIGVDTGDITQETEKIKTLLNDHNIIDTQSILNEVNSPHDAKILTSQKILAMEHKNPSNQGMLAPRSKKMIENAYITYRDFLRHPTTPSPEIKNNLPLIDKSASYRINYLLITTILGGGIAFSYALMKASEIVRKKGKSL